MEPRLLLTIQPVFVGSVYIEEDLGSDSSGDTFVLTFQGGAPDTQLLGIEIDGDQNTTGFNVGDVFFDTATNPDATGSARFGADESFAVSILSQEGIDRVTPSVVDGSTKIRFDFVGFDPGEVLRFSVDVDEVEDYDPAQSDTQLINDGFDPITSGVEFQGSTFVAELAAPNFEPLQVSSTFLNRYDSAIEGTNLELPADNENGKRDRTAGTVAMGEQIVMPASLRGHVYHDSNMNGRRDAGEAGIEGVTIQAVPMDTVLEQAVQSAVTNADGGYLFPELMPGTYRLLEVDQPDGYLDWIDAAGTVDGVPSGQAVNPGDVIEEVLLPGGSQGIDYDFGEILPVAIQGRVHLATPEGDCFSENIDHEPVAGVTIRLADEQGNVIAETVTDQLGQYEFTELAPGTYSVFEVTPEGLFEGGARAGEVDGDPRGRVLDANSVTEIRLGPGEVVTQVDFCEQEPVSIRGQVHLSTPEGDCFSSDIEHEPLVGVTIRLLNEQGAEVARTLTDAQGRYQFFDLEPGTYSLVEETPDGLIEGGASAGWIDDVLATEAYVEGPNQITEIRLGPGQQAVEFDFCEHAPASLGGWVYHDRNNDGQRAVGEEGIRGVQLQLVSAAGQVVAEQTTDTAGAYEFQHLEAGSYRVVEIHPDGWLDGLDTAGRINALNVGNAINPGDEIQSITIGWGQTGVDYNFGELMSTAIMGDVHLSTVDGDCFSDQIDHEPIRDVLIQLLDTQGQILRETRTDADGEYAFRGLAPGEYQVRELTPAGLMNGGARPGMIAGGSAGVVANADLVTQIVLRSGQQAVDVDFCEHEPSEISGFVYHDENADGRRFGGESGIDNVTVLLIDSSGNEVDRTQTDNTGRYRFESLVAGDYRIVEVHPEGWLDAQDRAGRIDGVSVGRAINPGDEIRDVSIGWGQVGVDYNFGEYQPASLSGIVHTDLNRDCLLQDDERPLAGVTVQLISADGQVVATRQTNARGQFHFDQLRPGNYTLREIQPDEFFDGLHEAGTGGGDTGVANLIRQIEIGSGDVWTGYRFCEEPPGMLSGYVFQDGDNIVLQPNEMLPEDIAEIRDGLLTEDDRRLGGVVLELGSGIPGRTFIGENALPGTYPSGVIRTVTDADGYYEFTGLPRGNYAIYQVQPEGYLDGIDTPGTLPALAINAPLPPEVEPLIAALRPDHNFDAIVRIILPPGQTSELNNFSEVRIDRPLVPFPVPEPRVSEPLTPIDLRLPDLALAAPLEPLDYQPTPFGRVQLGISNTWHLSVIDGGTLRGSGVQVPSDGPFWSDNGETYRAGWMDANAQQLAWILPSETWVNQQHVFGARRSIPVAGDFNGDGMTEVGFYFEGQWFIDLNGNWRWDEEDLWAKLGYRDDQPVVGDWDGDGKDDIGVFGVAWPGDPRAVRREPGLPDLENDSTGVQKNTPPRPEEAAQRRRKLRLTRRGDTRSDVIDHVFHYGTHGDQAVSGDWNGDGIGNVGIFYKGVWHLDMNGDGVFSDDKDQEVEFGADGDIAIAGDFNGDGVDEIGILSNGRLILDLNRNYRVDDGDQVIVPSQPTGRPVVGDWNGDGIDEVAMTYDDMQFVEIDARN